MSRNAGRPKSGSARWVNGLRAIVEIADDLIGCADLDSVYRLAVERAREDSRLERCSIFVTDGALVMGTFGTNMLRQTTDERTYRTILDDKWKERFRFRTPREARWSVTQELCTDWQNNGMRLLDKGWIAITPIQASHKAVGVFCNDTAITHAPVDTVKQDLVAVFCSLLGSILERKAIEAERAKLALALEQSLDAVIITDTTGRHPICQPRP